MFQMKRNPKHKVKNKSIRNKPRNATVDSGVIKKKDKNKPLKDLKKLKQIVSTKCERDNVHVKSQPFRPGKDFKQVRVSKELLEKYHRGQGPSGKGIRPGIEKNQILNKDKAVEWATEQAARSTILLTEEPG